MLYKSQKGKKKIQDINAATFIAFTQKGKTKFHNILIVDNSAMPREPDL